MTKRKPCCMGAQITAMSLRSCDPVFSKQNATKTELRFKSETGSSYKGIVHLIRS